MKFNGTVSVDIFEYGPIKSVYVSLSPPKPYSDNQWSIQMSCIFLLSLSTSEKHKKIEGYDITLVPTEMGMKTTES